MERRVVTRIEPTRRAHGMTPINIPELRRVAGYARVSTDNEEQENSYEAQVRYFTNYIHNHEGWTFAGMYTEEERSYPVLFCEKQSSNKIPRTGNAIINLMAFRILVIPQLLVL